MKKIYVLLFAMMSAVSMYAQVSVTATAGTTGPTPYTTVNAAFTAINAGTHQGAITITVTGSTTEPAVAVPLLRSNAPSSYTSIAIKPSGTAVINGAAAPTASRGILEFNGADNVTIDGDDPGTAGARNLTIQAPAVTTTGVVVVRFASSATTDGATFNTIKNCIVIGSRSAATSTVTTYGIYSGTSGTTTVSVSGQSDNNDNLTIENNEVRRCAYAIYTAGTSTNFMDNLIIRNNIIGSATPADDVSTRGIFVQNTQALAAPTATAAIIEGNDIRGNQASGSTTALAGIEINSGNAGLIFRKNKVHDIVHSNTSGYGAYGISVTGATNNSAVTIANNFIWDMKSSNWSTSISAISTDLAIGLRVSAGATGLKIYNNSISLNTANFVPATAGYAGCVQLTVVGITGSDIRNNIFSMTMPGAVGSKYYCMITPAAFPFGTLDNNDYYVSTGNFVAYNGADRATLALWQAQTTKDAASISVNPDFNSSTDLHISTGSASVNNLGASIAAITDDIDGDVRGATPDIGADEYTPVLCSAPPTGGTTNASVTGGCAGGTTNLSVSGASAGIGITYQWESSPDNAAWANVSGATLVGYTATLTTGTTYYRRKITCSGQDDWSVSIAITGVNCSFDIVKNNTGFTSISGSGNSLSGWRNTTTNTDDNLSTAQPIGFTFQYKGLNYTQFSASTNGFMTFNVGTAATGGGTGAYGYSNSQLSTNGGSAITLAPFYEDLVCPGNPGTLAGLNAGIKYQLDGTAPNRILTVEWIGFETFGNAGPNLNFQVKLYETTNKIEYVYGTMELFNGTANYSYSYSLGLSGTSISGTPTVDELQSQQVANVQNFAPIASNILAKFQDCNFKYEFTPGTYSGAGSTPAITNDEAATATLVSVNSSPCAALCGTYYSTSGASTSASIPVCSAATPGTPDDDVWFRFVATTSSQTITVRGAGGYDPVVQLFSDAGITSLSCVNATGAGLTETINATGLTPTSTYYIRIYNSGVGNGSTTDISLCVNEVIAPPSNDDPCGAQSLTVGSGVCTPYEDNPASLPSKTAFIAATNTTTNGVVAPTCSGAGASVQDVWFNFVATAAEQNVTVTPKAGTNVAFQMFTVASGTCAGSNLVLTAGTCYNNGSTGVAEAQAFTGLTIGTTYYIRVYAHPSGQGGAPVSNSQFSICVNTPPVPNCTTNSSPANAAVNISVTPTLTWAAAAGATNYDVYIGTPDLAAAQAATPVNLLTTSYTVSPALAYGTVYYWFVVPKNTTGPATGCSSNATSFTTAVCSPATATYSTQRVGTCPTSTQFEIVVNVTSLGNAPSIDILNNGGAPTITGVTATGNYTVGPFNYGTSVIITLDHPIGTTCDVNSSSITMATCPPPNDNICNAIALILDGAADCQNTATATLESQESTGGVNACSTPNNTVWYTYTPATTGLVQFVMETPAATNSSQGFWITGYTVTGCPTATLTTVIPCTGNAFAVGAAGAKDSLGLYLTGGTTYYFQIDGFSGDFGNFCLKIKTPSITPGVANACFASAATVTISTANNNNNIWLPISDADGNIVLEINANGNDLGATTFNLYKNTNAVRSTAGRYYLDRNFTITPTTQPSTPVDIRLYYTEAERLALETIQGVPAPGLAINCTKNSQTCSGTYVPGDPLEVVLTPTASTTYGPNGHYNSYTVSSFSTFYLHTGSRALPVVVNYLQGNKQGTSHNLNWKVTCTSSPSVTMVLERSADNRTYKTINSVFADAVRCGSPFNYVDASPLAGINYYRLRITDAFGKVTYSNNFVMNNSKDGISIVNIAPNPATTTTTVNVASAKNGTLRLVITDITGRQLMVQNESIIAGSNQIPLNVSKLAAGSYQLTAISEDGTKMSLRFIKQ